MCSLLITFANTLDLDQAQHVVVPDLDPKLKLFDFLFIYNFNVYIPERIFLNTIFNFEKIQQMTKNHAKITMIALLCLDQNFFIS